MLLGFGDESNVLMRAMSKQPEESDNGDDESTAEDEAGAGASDEPFERALDFAVRTLEIVLKRWGDKNTMSCIHTTLVFVLYMSRLPAAMAHLQGRFPWRLTSMMLNYQLKTAWTNPRIDSVDFPGPEKGQGPWPLQEDYALRGLVFAEDFFPDGWFDNDKIDETDRHLEPASKTMERQERILWIGRRIADSGQWLTWDAERRKFGVADEYSVAVDGLPDDEDGQSEGPAEKGWAVDA